MSERLATSKPQRLGRSRPPTGAVRRGLVEAGIALARIGGPEAVVLREATRAVGVSPNAAYRHFVDRDALLAAVCMAAMQEMASRMEVALSEVRTLSGTIDGALARLTAIGQTYLDFATAEPGLFATAFAVPRHLDYGTAPAAAGPGGLTPLQLLQAALDELVDVGAVAPERRADAEYLVWSCVHGMAVLRNQGPLREIASDHWERLTDGLLAFVVRGV